MSSSKEPGISTDPDQTRPVALYKIIANQVLDECWQVIDEDEADNYTSLEVDDLGDEALLVFGRKTLKNLDWVAMIDQLTGLDLDYKGSEASAILFVKVDDNTYALTFGGGWRLLRSGKIDRDFGLNFALRALDADEIRHIKRLYFNAKSRVDINVVPAGQALWSFGIREHAELVRQITGKVLPASRVNLSHIRKMAKKRATRISIDCTERIRLPLPYSAAHLAEDLREVTRVLTSYKVDPELAPLQWIRRMTADETESLDDPAFLASIRRLPAVGGRPVPVCRTCQSAAEAHPERFRAAVARTQLRTGVIAACGLLSLGFILSALLRGPRA